MQMAQEAEQLLLKSAIFSTPRCCRLIMCSDCNKSRADRAETFLITKGNNMADITRQGLGPDNGANRFAPPHCHCVLGRRQWRLDRGQVSAVCLSFLCIGAPWHRTATHGAEYLAQ